MEFKLVQSPRNMLHRRFCFRFIYLSTLPFTYSDKASSGCRERNIIVANMLPLHIQRDPNTPKLTFSFDEESLLWQLKDGFSPDKSCLLIVFSAYKRSNRRAIFLDYDGILIPHSSIMKSPSPELITILNTLCDDPKNTMFIVIGRGKSTLSEWLSPCERLGLAAEHGCYVRWSKNSDWQPGLMGADLEWKEIAEPMMELYREATDGLTIETKDSGLVWHHQDVGPDFGSCQAKELLVHLENVLANESALVKRGRHIVEVKPQGVSKGLVAEKVLSTMIENGQPLDFIACIGDDRSDEDMCESIMNIAPNTPEIFACTVGRKPSKAKYYLDDTVDVVKLLSGLANASDPKPSNTPARFQVTFDANRDGGRRGRSVSSFGGRSSFGGGRDGNRFSSDGYQQQMSFHENVKVLERSWLRIGKAQP
ncbi:probable alpha,alpha-trehalose-phosphate synthase [UDP-forming] 10 [Tanacetum coccineum]